MKILMVCLGNICRSPTAEAVLRHQARDRGLDVEVDSAGTAAYHEGSPPDARMTSAAAEAGITLGGAARRVTREDLDEFDLVVAMDHENLADLRRLARPDQLDRLILLRDHDASPDDGAVPDPYYGGIDGFRDVVRIVQRSCAGLLDAIEDGRIAPTSA